MSQCFDLFFPGTYDILGTTFVIDTATNSQMFLLNKYVKHMF